MVAAKDATMREYVALSGYCLQIFLGLTLSLARPSWFVLFLVRVLFGSCSFEFVLFLVCALFGLCPFHWKVAPNSFFKQSLKVSAFYLKKQKSFISKKNFLGCCQYQNKKALFTDPVFSEGFGGNNQRFITFFRSFVNNLTQWMKSFSKYARLRSMKRLTQ